MEGRWVIYRLIHQQDKGMQFVDRVSVGFIMVVRVWLPRWLRCQHGQVAKGLMPVQDWRVRPERVIVMWDGRQKTQQCLATGDPPIRIERQVDPSLVRHKQSDSCIAPALEEAPQPVGS